MSSRRGGNTHASLVVLFFKVPRSYYTKQPKQVPRQNSTFNLIHKVHLNSQTLLLGPRETHRGKNRAPWRWPRNEAETFPSNNKQKHCATSWYHVLYTKK